MSQGATHKMNGPGGGPSLTSVLATNGGQKHPRHHGHHHHHGHSHHHLPHRQSLRTTLWRPLRLLWREAKTVLWDRGGAPVRRLTALLGANLLSAALVAHWAAASNSLALTAFSYITWFHILNLLTCYLSQWVGLKSLSSSSSLSPGLSRKETKSEAAASAAAAGIMMDRIRIQQEGEDPNLFTLGRGRYEVLAVFSSTVLSQLSGLFLLKESLERMLEPEDVHTEEMMVDVGTFFTIGGRLMFGALVCLLVQLTTTFLAPSTALAHVIEVSSSSWLQEHTSDLAHSVCNLLPSLTPLLLPRVNPLALLSVAAFAVVAIVDVAIEINDTHWADPAASLSLSLFLLGTMHPLTSYAGRVLLQTTPAHLVPQLDRMLREALTIDGVLEFKNEHFWTVSFGKLAGSLTVRVRKDADEQLVLAHVTDRLSDLVWPLTVQISRDEHALAKLKQTSMRFLGGSDGGDARLLRHYASSPALPRETPPHPQTTPNQQQQQQRQNGSGRPASFLSSTPDAAAAERALSAAAAAAAAGAGAVAGGGASPGMSPLGSSDGSGARNAVGGSAGVSPVLMTSTPKEGESLKQRLLVAPSANLLTTPPPPHPQPLPPAPLPTFTSAVGPGSESSKFK